MTESPSIHSPKLQFLQRLRAAGRQKFERACVTSSSLGRLSNGAVLAWLIAQRRLAPAWQRAYPMHVEVCGRSARLRVGSGSDETVFAEVFVDQQYSTLDIAEPEVILDLGGNVGFSAVYFALRFPRARIFTLEPNPHAYARLLQNTRPFSNISAHQLALAADQDVVDLYADPGSTMSSSLRQRRAGAEQLRVAATTLDAFLRAQQLDHVDILKFDIEGAEYALFNGCQCLPAVRFIIGEVHDDLLPVPAPEFRRLLADYDLTEVATSPMRRLVHGPRKRARTSSTETPG